MIQNQLNSIDGPKKVLQINGIYGDEFFVLKILRSDYASL